MKKLFLFILWLTTQTALSQSVSGLFVASKASPATLSLVGPDSVAEGSSQVYMAVLTSPESGTSNVSDGATFTASRGASSGLGITRSGAIILTNAANAVPGDNRITRITISYGGMSASREIVLKDATTTYTAKAGRMVNSTDIAAWPQMKLGDYIIEGGNNVSVSSGQYTINIQSSQGNVPTLSPGAVVWVKGGTYSGITLQLSQARTSAGQSPVEVRNYDGQVIVRGTLAILGAQGAKVTGRYEPSSGKGDADYTGHASGYAFTAGRYGFLCDNQFGTTQADIGRSGITLDGGCQRVEIEYVEIRHYWFAGILSNFNNYDLNVAGSTTPISYQGLSFHDLYIHNVVSEGLYIGNTGTNVSKGDIEDLAIYNNRIFSGSESIQVNRLLGSATIYNNVTLSSMEWRDNFQPFQDNTSQAQVLTPTKKSQLRFEKNICLVGGEKHVNGQTRLRDTGYTLNPSDTTILYRKNALLFNRGPMYIYYNTQSIKVGNVDVRQTIPNLRLAFDQNYLGKQNFVYNQVYQASTDIPQLFKFDLLSAFVSVTGNTFDGSSSTKTSFVLNAQPSSATIVESGNTLNGSVPLPAFKNFLGLGNDYDLSRVEYWADSSATKGYGQGVTPAPVTVNAGDIRIVGTSYYQAKLTNVGIKPGVNPAWRTYYDLIYWDRNTGQIVRNPANPFLPSLSAYPPHAVDEPDGAFYRTAGIGLIN